MKPSLDLLPVVIFAVVYFTTDVFTATAALMIAVTAQVAFQRLRGQPITRELRLTFFASLIFGGLTLLFRDQLFIQWKPTIVNGLLALSLFGSHFVGEQTLVQRLLGRQLDLPQPVWARLNFGWACGFTLAALLNLWVAYNFSIDVWVTYKLVGGFALTLTYIIATVVYLAYKGFLRDEHGAAVDAGKAP